MRDLFDIPTEDLVKEIFSRFDAAVFNGRRFNEKGSVEYLDFHGDTTMLLGLCQKLIKNINEVDEKTEDGFN